MRSGSGSVSLSNCLPDVREIFPHRDFKTFLGRNVKFFPVCIKYISLLVLEKILVGKRKVCKYGLAEKRAGFTHHFLEEFMFGKIAIREK